MSLSVGTSSELSSEMNVTPLIDVLLVLLIIFMVIVPLTPRGLSSALPQEKSNTVMAQPALIELRSGPTPGTVLYRVNHREVAPEAIGPMLRAMFSMQPERTVILKADRALTYEPVAIIVGEAKRQGASNVVMESRE